MKITMPAILGLLLSVAPVSAFDFGYVINNNNNIYTVTIISYSGTGGAVTIPSTIYYPAIQPQPLPVVEIGNSAFAGSINLASVVIPSSITDIDEWAFQGCTNLTQIYFMGNVPALHPTPVLDTTPNTYIFYNDPATVYYSPSSGGWTSSLGGLPTVMWYTTIQTEDGSFGISNNQFGFNITGATNIPITVEACTNLNLVLSLQAGLPPTQISPVWSPIQMLTLTNGLFYFSDPQWTNFPDRFYRIGPQ
jgi:hypothetical protein